MRRLPGALLAAAVALAFADTSIVVLGLPDIYTELGASVVGVSWTITTYALALGVCAGAVAALRRCTAVGATLATAVGLVLFAAGSLGCGWSGSLAALLTGRGVQGMGAALVLVASPPLLPSRKAWGVAAAVGVTAGPAIGGFLTQAFSWRAIFFVQAPVAAGALLLLLADRRRPEPQPAPDDAAPLRSRAVATLADVLLAASLVGALFLSVLLVVEAWRYEPLAGALIVSPLPVGALAARASAGRFAAGVRMVTGGALLAGGLAGLALVPSAAAPAMVALLLAGFGFGLLSGTEDELGIDRTVMARHLGLVVGLLLIAPLLSTSLDAAGDRATLGATKTLLDARLDIRTKVDVARELRDTVHATPRGEVPDIAAAFRRVGSDSDAALAHTGDDVLDRIEAVITRAFRPSFAAAAGMAALAAALAALAQPRPWRMSGAALLAAGVLGVGALLGGELAAGGWTEGDVHLADPCTAGPDTYTGGSLDETAQRIALSALNGAACELGTSREHIVLSLDGSGKISGITWDDRTLDRALEAGGLRAVDDAEARGLPFYYATPLRAAIRVAPLRWFLERAQALPDMPELPDLPDLPDLPSLSDLPFDLPFSFG